MKAICLEKVLWRRKQKRTMNKQILDENYEEQGTDYEYKR